MKAKATLLALLFSLSVASAWTPTSSSFDTNVFVPLGYVYYLKTNAIAAMAGVVASSGSFGTTNGSSTNVGGFLKALSGTQYWSFNGVGLTNLSIPLASVTNAGTIGYSNAGAYIPSVGGAGTNTTVKSNLTVNVSGLESFTLHGPTGGPGLSFFVRSGNFRATNSVTLDWIDFNDGLKLGDASSASTAKISLDSSTGLAKFGGMTASRAVVSGSDGYLASSATTAAQVGYLSDVTGLIQAQLDGKQAGPLTGDITTSGAAATLKNTGTAGTYRSVTFDAQGRETSGSNPTTFSGYGISDSSANFFAAITDESGNAGVVPRFSLTSVTSGDYPSWNGSAWVNLPFPTTVSDTAFASSWNGVTTIAPSKNALYDWAHTFDTDDDGKVNVLDMGAGVVVSDSGGVVSAASFNAGTALQNVSGVFTPITTEVLTNGATQNTAWGGSMTNLSSGGVTLNVLGFTTNSSFAPDMRLGWSETNVNAAFTLSLPINKDANQNKIQTSVFCVATNGGGGTVPFALTSPTGVKGTGSAYVTNYTVVTVTIIGSRVTNYNYNPIY